MGGFICFYAIFISFLQWRPVLSSGVATDLLPGAGLPLLAQRHPQTRAPMLPIVEPVRSRLELRLPIRQLGVPWMPALCCQSLEPVPLSLDPVTVTIVTMAIMAVVAVTITMTIPSIVAIAVAVWAYSQLLGEIGQRRGADGSN